MNKTIMFCETHDIEVPKMDDTYILRGGRARRQLDHFTNERFYRVEIFLVTIDRQLKELNDRFNEKVMNLLSGMVTLIPSHGFKSFDSWKICELVRKYYPEDFTEQERIGLEHQLNHVKKYVSSDDKLVVIENMRDLFKSLTEAGGHKIFHLVDRLIRLLLILPVSTTSAECDFSALKIIKTRLRSKFGDQFLNDNLLVYIEREIAEKYDFKDIIKDFKDMGKRRAPL